MFKMKENITLNGKEFNISNGTAYRAYSKAKKMGLIE